jgi:hypothetical protein
MLEAVPTNVFSTNFRLQQQNQLLGEVDTSIWREKGQLELEDGTYQLYREGPFSGDFILEHNGKLVARARRSNIDLPADWPLPIRIFLFWLAFLMWKRQSQAAS